MPSTGASRRPPVGGAQFGTQNKERALLARAGSSPFDGRADRGFGAAQQRVNSTRRRDHERVDDTTRLLVSQITQYLDCTLDC